MKFPDKFVWGTATASYQVEGGARVDGRGESVWDACCRVPGFVQDGDTGDVACDAYHLWPEDIRCMQEMGVGAYRFSIAWPRVLPEGTGRVNEAGLAYYDRIIDALLKAGITPYVTLFHWDYPEALYHRGGWLSPDSPEWFAEYTDLIVRRYSDRVTHWITQNEPQCFIGLGHIVGEHAPGLRLPMGEALLAAHRALLAHGRAVQAIRAASKQPCQVGYAFAAGPTCPASNSPADVEAARQATFAVPDSGLFCNSWWMDPIYLGRYPQEGLDKWAKLLTFIGPDDMKTIAQPMDFVGVNIYSGGLVRAGADGRPEEAPLPQGMPRTTMGWPVTPEALYYGPKFYYERYRKPIYVTENGMACCDWPSEDGQVHDPQRVDFLRRYIRAFGRAGEDGVPIGGYFCWSLLDNFEWAHGYSKRFGLVYVDYPTQKRIVKDSGHWYADVARSNGRSL